MLKVNHLSKSYRTGSQTYPVSKEVSFEVKKKEFVAVMGPSGSGKTTLLNCISCFIPHDDGEILLNGRNLSGLNEQRLSAVRNKNLGFVFQDFMLLDGLTVFGKYLSAADYLQSPGTPDGGESETSVVSLSAMKISWKNIPLRFPAERSSAPL